MSDAPKPATSTAVPLTLRTQAAPSETAPLVMRRSSLGFDAVQTATCPGCGVRPSQQVERFTVLGKSTFVDVTERVLSPVSVIALALLSGMATETVWWPMIMVFGPSAAISSAASIRLGWAPRYRLKVALCPSCAANIRASRKKTRAWRVVKNASAWALVMMAPLVFTPLLGDHLALFGPGAGALSLLCSVGHWLERNWRRKADALLPSPTVVGDREARLNPPAHWMPVLRTEAPALLPPAVKS